MTPKFPNITVRLTGTDGNAYAVVAKVVKALRNAGKGSGTIESFKQEALSDDYDHLLQTAMKWVNVE